MNPLFIDALNEHWFVCPGPQTYCRDCGYVLKTISDPSWGTMHVYPADACPEGHEDSEGRWRADKAAIKPCQLHNAKNAKVCRRTEYREAVRRQRFHYLGRE